MRTKPPLRHVSAGNTSTSFATSGASSADADLIIAFLDAANDQHQRAIDELQPRLGAGQQIIVGANVYAEVMVRPMQSGDENKVDEFLDAISATAANRSTGASPRELRGCVPGTLHCVCPTRFRSPRRWSPMRR